MKKADNWDYLSAEWYLFIIRQLSHDVVSSSLRVTVALDVCDWWIFRLKTVVL